jgi:hypothetical protein
MSALGRNRTFNLLAQIASEAKHWQRFSVLLLGPVEGCAHQSSVGV